MPLVQSPRTADRDPFPCAFVERELGGTDRAHLDGGVDDVGPYLRVREVAPAAARLVATLAGEVDVDPTREQVLQVPLALPMAKQDERVRHGEHSARPVVSGPDMGIEE